MNENELIAKTEQTSYDAVDPSPIIYEDNELHTCMVLKVWSVLLFLLGLGTLITGALTQYGGRGYGNSIFMLVIALIAIVSSFMGDHLQNRTLRLLAEMCVVLSVIAICVAFVTAVVTSVDLPTKSGKRGHKLANLEFTLWFGVLVYGALLSSIVMKLNKWRIDAFPLEETWLSGLVMKIRRPTDHMSEESLNKIWMVVIVAALIGGFISIVISCEEDNQSTGKKVGCFLFEFILALAGGANDHYH